MVEALDVDAASIKTAHANIVAAGLADRVWPAVQDASAPELGGPYDLITIFEALHDMNHPVPALRAARNRLAEGGSVVIADERVAERFSAPGDEIQRFKHGWSVMHCLAVGLLDRDSAGTGTVIRSDTVRTYAVQAGFDRVEVLPIGHATWPDAEGFVADRPSTAGPPPAVRYGCRLQATAKPAFVPSRRSTRAGSCRTPRRARR